MSKEFKYMIDIIEPDEYTSYYFDKHGYYGWQVVHVEDYIDQDIVYDDDGRKTTGEVKKCRITFMREIDNDSINSDKHDA